MSKDKFNLKQECIFVSLSSYAHDIITKGDIYAFNGEAIFMANAITAYFKEKKVKRYSKTRTDKLIKYLDDVMGPAFPDKINASIIMVASLHYLLSENHYESKIVFGPFKFKIQFIIETLEKSEHKDELKKANETLVKMLDAKPANFKTNIDKDIAIKQQHVLLSVLDNLVNNTQSNDKFFKPFEKIKSILEPYKDMMIKEINIEISPDNKDNIYYIVAVLENLKKIISNKLDCIDKFKKINLNYLVPDKFLYNRCVENIKNNLL